MRQLKRGLQKLVEIGELRINPCAGPFGTNLYELPLLHSYFPQGEGPSQGVTGCVMNKEKREGSVDSDLWKSIREQIAELAKAKAL